MAEQRQAQKSKDKQEQHSVLGEKQEFLDPEHKSSGQPSHQVQEMSKPTDKDESRDRAPKRPDR